MKKILLVLSLMFLISCSQSLDIQLDPEVDVFLSKNSKQTIRLTPQDKEYVSLNEWLANNRSGWHPTSGRYPGGVYLTSGDYGIQVTETHVIIYSTSSHEPKALYIQKVAKGELREIINLAK
jgi:hypothetical protein